MRSMFQSSFSLLQGGAFEFGAMRQILVKQLRSRFAVHRGTWQSEDVSQSDAHATFELPNLTFITTIPETMQTLQDYVSPDLPWAEDHFQERVSGEPLNPAPSYVNWPYHSTAQRDRHVHGGVFSHTYPERFWPKRANPDEVMQFQNGRHAEINCGIRYAYGDLDDVVALLVKEPFTRQAYLPVWFPEDTGAVGDVRVPCTLGYHFIRRGMELDCNYIIRSCDVYRHFTNDVYMAARLCQWVVQSISTGENMIRVGHLNMFISNLHLFRGDIWKIDRQDTTC